LFAVPRVHGYSERKRANKKRDSSRVKKKKSDRGGNNSSVGAGWTKKKTQINCWVCH